MNCLESRYYELNRLLLSVIGIWPFANTPFARMQKILCTYLIASGVVFQLTTFITHECKLEFVLTVLSFTSVSMTYLLKYLTFLLNSEKIRTLFGRIQEDWNSLQGEEELEIIKSYAETSRLLTKLFTLLVYPACAAFALGTVAQSALPAFTSANVTVKLPVTVELFIDQDKYFFFVLGYTDVTMLIGASAMVAAETTFTVFVQHACGLFKIACYRIEVIFEENTVYDSASQRQCEIYARVIRAIRMHKRAIEFTEYLASTFATSNMVLVAIGVGSVALNLFRLSRTMVRLSDVNELAVMLTVTGGEFGYMFYLNYVCQEIINHSSNVFATIYDSTWYTAPLPTQKALLVMMKRSMRPSSFVIGAIFVASNEGFSTIARLSVSYYAALVSLQ